MKGIFFGLFFFFFPSLSLLLRMIFAYAQARYLLRAENGIIVCRIFGTNMTSRTTKITAAPMMDGTMMIARWTDFFLHPLTSTLNKTLNVDSVPTLVAFTFL